MMYHRVNNKLFDSSNFSTLEKYKIALVFKKLMELERLNYALSN